MQRKLNGWIRAAIVFTAFWLAILSAIAIYEHATTGAWDYFGKNRGLVFHTWLKDVSYTKEPIEGFDDLHLVFHSRRFWLWLILPVVAVWVFSGVLVPSIRWIRDGFRT